jgi:hypothetical protein
VIIERLSPEARNARPFYHLLPRWGRRERAETAPGASALAPTPNAPEAP